jgi:hypothetical protein
MQRRKPHLMQPFPFSPYSSARPLTADPLGIASLILGIVALILTPVSLPVAALLESNSNPVELEQILYWIGNGVPALAASPVAGLGMLLAIIALRKAGPATNRGFAITDLILNTIALAFALVIGVFVVLTLTGITPIPGPTASVLFPH